MLQCQTEWQSKPRSSRKYIAYVTIQNKRAWPRSSLSGDLAILRTVIQAPPKPIGFAQQPLAGYSFLNDLQACLQFTMKLMKFI